MVQVFLETISGLLSLEFVYETDNRRFKILWIMNFFSFVASRIFVRETRFLYLLTLYTGIVINFYSHGNSRDERFY